MESDTSSGNTWERHIVSLTDSAHSGIGSALGHQHVKDVANVQILLEEIVG